MKKLLALTLALLLLLAMGGCGGKQDGDKTLKIGVIQYLSHPSLDNCYKGIEESLKASGLKYEIDKQTGSNNSPDADCVSFANNMASSGEYDMIIAIATPAAKAAFAATDDTDIPVIFCAVSDPVEAKIVKSNDKPGYACTGTSDVLDLNAQIDLIKALQPDVKSIGVIYTSSEDNSISNLNNFKKICEERGLTLKTRAVQSGAEVPAAANALAAEVDCINNFTDNNVVTNLDSVLKAADQYSIPVYGSEEEQVKNGCLASVSIDYVALGKVTGDMAVSVLKGEEKIEEMPVKSITDATPIVNTDVLAKLSLKMPESYGNATTVTTSK